VAAPPADAQRTSSGLRSKVLQRGKGIEHPGPEDKVIMRYTGWMTSGVLIDSSGEGGQIIERPVRELLRGWAEGLQLMVPGEKRRLWIPGNLGYGDKPRPFGRPYGTLVFDVELLSFKRPPAPPEVPADLKAPPAEARRMPSGLVYRVLTPGTGKKHPRLRSVVEVNYTGWTADGKMFDSSVIRGQTATFALNQVIRGWSEGLQLMVAGEKGRLWIPAKLAYGDKAESGAPAGNLVFDVELLDIRDE
jgi:peptidylprolyl isomerase